MAPRSAVGIRYAERDDHTLRLAAKLIPMTTCPYCNAPLLAELAGHVICPRCGETVRGVDAERPLARAEQSEDDVPLHTNRQVGFMVLAIMVLMASIALAFALRTTQFRRANDNKGQEVPRATPAVAVRPGDWAGLGYIPDDVHALLGVDVARLSKSAVGQALDASVQCRERRADWTIGRSLNRWSELEGTIATSDGRRAFADSG